MKFLGVFYSIPLILTSIAGRLAAKTNVQPDG
jgi:hypothetical protein